MGGPKHTISLNAHETLGTRATGTLAKVCGLVVAAGPPEALDGVQCIPDHADHAGFGPLAGIEAVLLSGAAHRWVFLPCDMPDMRAESLWRLVEVSGPVVGFEDPDRASGVAHFPLCVDSSQAASLSARLAAGKRAVGDWLAEVEVVRVPAPSACELRNINRPEDLESR